MRRTDELLPGNPWLRRLRDGNGATRVICFPHAGGSASYFRRLAKMLSADTEVLAVQYPGRGNRLREQPIESVPLLAEGIASALPASDKQDVLFGHSLGGHIAFEVAQRLPVRKLVVSGIVAPSKVVDLGYRLLNEAEGIERIAALGGLPPEILNDPSALSALFPVLRSDFTAGETYTPPPDATVACDITALIGDKDVLAPLERVSSWREHTRANFDLQVFRGGGHFYLEDHIDEVSACLIQVCNVSPII